MLGVDGASIRDGDNGLWSWTFGVEVSGVAVPAAETGAGSDTRGRAVASAVRAASSMTTDGSLPLV